MGGQDFTLLLNIYVSKVKSNVYPLVYCLLLLFYCRAAEISHWMRRMHVYPLRADGRQAATVVELAQTTLCQKRAPTCGGAVHRCS